jgi:hypothetical protein
MAIGDQAVEWKGGSLEDLVGMLSGPALAARIEVLAPEPGTRNDRVAGEVHMVAGGVSEAKAGELRGDEALAHLKALPSTRFRVEPVVPEPESGGIDPPGPEEGLLTQRSLASLMRYCEQYVMTCHLEVWRGGEQATIRYRRGEIASTVVDGSDSPERLPEVMTWTEGRYRIVLPPLVLPAPPRAIRPSVPDQRTLFGYVPPEPIRPMAREVSPRDTQPRMPPVSEQRSTHPGRPVDVFDAVAPERTTDVGVPAQSAPEPPRPAPADGARALAASSAPVRRPSPDGAAAREPVPAAGAIPREPMAVGGATLAPGPSAVTPPVGVPAATLAKTRPSGAARPTRRVAVRRRTLSDLPVAAHVGLGLALGLAVVGAYWVIQGILSH